MDQIHINGKPRPVAIAGDKAYDVPRIRQWCKRRSIKAVIPEKRKAKRKRGRPYRLDRDAYRKRNVAERCIGWLKICRRVGTRSEKLAIHFLAIVKLAMIQRCLRLITQPSDTT